MRKITLFIYERPIGLASYGRTPPFAGMLRKVRFCEARAGITLSERQRKMIDRLLDGSKSRLTSSRWAKVARSSQDTAIHDINDLVVRGILVKQPGGGRSTSYALKD